MLACTFFGHRDCPASVRCRLHQVLTELIERRGVTVFYVGNQGRFDAMAYAVLNELKATHPEVICRIVLAYMPRKPADGGPDTLLPAGLENVPKRFAIDRRNRWMIEQADFVLTYVTHPWGGAAKFAAIAQKRGRTICPLGELEAQKP